jgi:hypothetical protein
MLPQSVRVAQAVTSITNAKNTNAFPIILLPSNLPALARPVLEIEA